MKYYTLNDLSVANEIFEAAELGLITYSTLLGKDRETQDQENTLLYGWACQVRAFFRSLYKGARILKRSFFQGDWQLSVKTIWETVRNGKFADIHRALSDLRKRALVAARQAAIEAAGESFYNRVPQRCSQRSRSGKWEFHIRCSQVKERLERSFVNGKLV